MNRPSTSKELRAQFAWRASFNSDGPWGIPLVKKQDLTRTNIDLISFSDTKPKDHPLNTEKGVHFFIDDHRFSGIYAHPDRTLEKLKQYAFLLTPDNSLYAEMEPWQQIESIGKSRWVGAYWQSQGLTVYPTVSWGTPRTFRFCFDGIEKHSVVAIGMIGCKHNKHGYLKGYDAMLEAVEPSDIICFGKPFPEMKEVTAVVDYIGSRKAVR